MTREKKQKKVNLFEALYIYDLRIAVILTITILFLLGLTTQAALKGDLSETKILIAVILLGILAIFTLSFAISGFRDYKSFKKTIKGDKKI